VNRSIPPVVKGLLIINVALFLLTLFLQNSGISLIEYLSLFYPTSPYFHPYQIITHMFMHGGWQHILFNMFALWMFGSMLENIWGPKRFLFFYLFCGLGAAAVQLASTGYMISQLHSQESIDIITNTPTLGASGAIFGLLVAFGYLFPNTELFIMFIPIPVKAKYVVIGYAGLELFLGFSGFEPGVAHFAHLGGALFGFLLVLYWNRTGKNFY
jgi:membrane associated rhomboid family serine protease